jgi:prepilin-type processing-associated H-X9-DG protein
MYPWFGAGDVVLGVNDRIGVNFASAPNGQQSWYQPGELDDDEDPFDDPHAWHFWSFHPGGSNFLFADGSVRFIPYSVTSPPPGRDLLRVLATRNGRADGVPEEVVNDDF